MFGDKRGLLDALASYGFQRYLDSKQHAHTSTGNVVGDLRTGWDNHISFGLAQPQLYLLMYASAAKEPPAPAKAAYQALLATMQNVAAAGTLRVPADIAANMIQSAARGVTLRLIGNYDNNPALDELSPRVRDAILTAILTEPPAASPGDLAARALTLDAALPPARGILTAPETSLLREWLRRLAGR